MKKFQRTKENFTCSHCSAEVIGNGYTNHCPHCLWSQHVDVNPGDRAAVCGGMMKPIQIESSEQRSKGDWIIVHECVVCGYKKKNKVAKEDNIEVVTQIAREFAEKLF